MGDWNTEPHELSQAGWLNTVNGKVFATSVVTCCAGGEGSEAMAHLVQQVEVVHNSTTPHSHSKLRLGVTGSLHDVPY